MGSCEGSALYHHFTDPGKRGHSPSRGEEDSADLDRAFKGGSDGALRRRRAGNRGVMSQPV